MMMARRTRDVDYCTVGRVLYCTEYVYVVLGRKQGDICYEYYFRPNKIISLRISIANVTQNTAGHRCINE